MDQPHKFDISQATLPGLQPIHPETPTDDGSAISHPPTARLDSLDTLNVASDKAAAPDLAATQAPASTESETRQENLDGAEGQSIGSNLSDSPAESGQNTSEPHGLNANETVAAKNRKARNSGTAPASAAISRQKPENCESPFQIRKIRTPVERLPELSGPLSSLAMFRAEHTYVARLTSALHRKALVWLLLMFPIIVATTTQGKRIVAGSRSWAIAKTELSPETTISAIEIGEVDEKTVRVLAVVDGFICGLYFCLSSGSMKRLADGYSVLSDENLEVAKELLPEVAKNSDLAALIGLREQTVYARRKSKGCSSEMPEVDQEARDE